MAGYGERGLLRMMLGSGEVKGVWMWKVSFSRCFPLLLADGLVMPGETTDAPCSIEVQVAAAAEEVEGMAMVE